MSRYINIRKDSALRSLEFASAQGQNLVFFNLRAAGDKEKLKLWLKSKDNSLEFIADAEQGDGQVLVAKTLRAKDDIIAALSGSGDSFTLEIVKKKFEGWKWRGILSLAGQGLDVASVFIATRKGSRSAGDNAAYFLFAMFNIMASLVNITFGAKKIPDTQRMQYLKTQINDAVVPYIGEGEMLPSAHENIMSHYASENTPPSAWQKARDYIRSHSVYIDMGLRSFGNLNLIIPVTKWGQAGWKNKLNDNPYTRAAGIALFAGKTVTVFSKVPDPYNPKPATALDRMREKVFFKFGNTVESLSALFMGYNSFVGTRNAKGIRKNNPASGLANVLFTFGYGARFFAPFGVRETDMPELEAHVSECLAKVPEDKLPQLTASISAGLKGDLKDEPIGFGKIYTHILENLAKRHPINPFRAQNGEATPTMPQPVFAAQELKRPRIAAKTQYTDRVQNLTPATMSV